MSMISMQQALGRSRIASACPCSVHTGAHHFTAASAELRNLQKHNHRSRSTHQIVAAQALFGVKSLGVGTSEVYVTGLATCQCLSYTNANASHIQSPCQPAAFPSTADWLTGLLASRNMTLHLLQEHVGKSLCASAKRCWGLAAK